ncbi:MAG: Rrf2 family transcriptional regulator, partial [Gemmatimonadetes bacterium]|nr:Rrf2 family transcriptional regulator [Gemmatimonadota bacterium]
MNLTRESEYALKGLAWLATHPPGDVVPLVEIAEVQQLPSTFLAKIFQKLARHGLLESDRGRGSG